MASKKHLVVLTGAGISAESGFSTFRDSNGLWENYKVEDVATPEGLAANPQLVLDFYNERHRQLVAAQPNYGHIGLAELQDEYQVDIITQNVDDLHERAGSKSVLHLHGELTKARSIRNENLVVDWPAGTDLHLGDLAPDGKQLRPHIVFFGEDVPNMTPACELVRSADILLIVGTSLVVYPAAGLVHYAPKGCPIYLIDPKPVSTSVPVHFIQEVASVGMKKFIDELHKL